MQSLDKILPVFGQIFCDYEQIFSRFRIHTYPNQFGHFYTCSNLRENTALENNQCGILEGNTKRIDSWWEICAVKRISDEGISAKNTGKIRKQKL